ncbi:MAG: site-specific integrase [Acidobacteriia bacterium]|nr:site-specific integrase [Terriglobia bacterium]
MLEDYFSDERVLCLRNGPMGPYLPHLVRTLEEQHFCYRAARRSVRRANALGLWLQQQGIPLSESNESHAKAFVAQRGRTPQGRLLASGVPKIVRILQTQGVFNAPEVRTETDCWLQRFDDHLARVHGLSPETRGNYLCYARRLLASRSVNTPLDWTSLNADEIQAFAHAEMEKLKSGRSVSQVSTAMRAIIRFLAAEGSVSPNLARALPPVQHWRHAGLPKHFSPEQLDRVLALCKDDRSLSFRDRAIVLLLARLGMRSGEVRQLQLEHVDWAEGTIHICLGKARRERILPLPEDVGAALVDYLRQERPPSSDRTIFLRSCPPYKPLRKIAEIVRRVLKKAGITGARVGAHHFRHTIATHMVRQGVSFKDVADVLGHRQLDTTAIYAKLDLPSLAGVALPWPGGAQ